MNFRNKTVIKGLAIILLLFCGIPLVQAVTLDEITPENIVDLNEHDMLRILYENISEQEIRHTLYCAYPPFETFIVNKTNTQRIIKSLTPMNITTIKNNNLIYILKADSTFEEKLVNDLISPENIEKIGPDLIEASQFRWNIKESSAAVLAKYISIKNIEKVNARVVFNIIKASGYNKEKGAYNLLHKFINLITAENITTISPDIMHSIVTNDRQGLVKPQFINLMNKDNIEKISSTTLWVLHDKNTHDRLKNTLAESITSKNIIAIDADVIKLLIDTQLLTTDQLRILYVRALKDLYLNYLEMFKNHNRLDLFIFDKKTENIGQALKSFSSDVNINQNSTQSSMHFENISHDDSKLIELLTKTSDMSDRQMLLRLLHKCHQEEEKGNITFIHGQQRWFFPYIEIFKRIVELQCHSGKSIEGYYPLRFVKAGDRYALLDDKIQKLVKYGLLDDKDGEYTLCMNAFLLGNLHNTGSCSLSYYLTNSDQSDNKNLEFTLRNIFKIYDFEHYYARYKQELDSLYDDFMKNKFRGTLLVLSCTPDQVKKWVYFSKGGRKKEEMTMNGQKSDDTLAFMKLLKNNSKSLDREDLEYGQWCLVLSDQSMDPINGVKIYPFTADDVYVRQWLKKLDAVFTKIKQDIEGDKQSREELFAGLQKNGQLKSKL